ncbi:hypothetical protein BDQ17DRAFT_1353890 [Cyathus striatus]|nr:hypothetical protein BDQ17DRAFT_1353890 [Cyathus striatus]
MELLQIAPFTNLLSHFRFLLTLRSKEGHYHSLILFRLSPGTDAPSQEDAARVDVEQNEMNPMYRQIYVMEASCPHLGADMSHADIEECDTGMVAVCPWHRYDFDLRTGKSEMGLKACTYTVHVKKDTDGVDKVYIETPEGGTAWKLVELRPVSEEFADPPPQKDTPSVEPRPATAILVEDEPVVPVDDPPKTLMQWAVLILNTPNPTLKVCRAHKLAVHLFRTGKLTSIGHKSANAPRPPDVPSRDDSWMRNTVEPGRMKSKKNRAIDLAWDIMARFGPTHPDLPPPSFRILQKWHWTSRSICISLLTSRLSATSPTTPYGSMPVHAALWESATVTSHSLRSRLAIIHLVHEARGLDVNPGTIERFRRAGDKDSVDVMEIIHADEVTHVTAGHRWFTWACRQEGLEGQEVVVFREEVRKGWRGDVKGPFNKEAREMAGMTPEFYEGLRGEMGISVEEKDRLEEVRKGVESVKVDYDI